MIRQFFTVFLFTILVANARAELTVTDVQGTTAAVEVFEVTKTHADVQIGGRRTKVALEELVPDSRERLLAYAKEYGKLRMYPDVRVEVNVGTKRRPVKDSFYMKEMEINPGFSIEGASQMVPLPKAEATVVVIVLDTAKKFTGRKEYFEVLARDVLEVPAAPDGKKRSFSFPDYTVTYDSYRDTSNIGGKNYKYFVFALRDAETGSIVEFQANDPDLIAYLKEHPDERERFLKLGKGSEYVAGPAAEKPKKQ